jgi:hypothetical protein
MFGTFRKHRRIEENILEASQPKKDDNGVILVFEEVGECLETFHVFV